MQPKWVPATSPTPHAGLLPASTPAGCRVYSGTAAYMSLEGARLFARDLSMLGTLNMGLIERLSRQMASNKLNARAAWADVKLNDDGQLNAVLIEAGHGEGQYASYWGYAGDGRLVSLATDFGVLSSI